MYSAYDSNNVFARIIRNEIKAEKIFDDEFIICIKDIHPSAPIHFLVLPKKSYMSFDDFSKNASSEEITAFFKTVGEIARIYDLDKIGYRLIINHGADGMQTVPHFHAHILGGKTLGPLVVGDLFHA